MELFVWRKRILTLGQYLARWPAIVSTGVTLLYYQEENYLLREYLLTVLHGIVQSIALAFLFWALCTRVSLSWLCSRRIDAYYGHTSSFFFVEMQWGTVSKNLHFLKDGHAWTLTMVLCLLFITTSRVKACSHIQHHSAYDLIFCYYK